MRLALPLLMAALALLIRGSMLLPRFPYIDDLLQLYAVTRPSAAEAASAVSGIGPLQPPLDYALGFLAARLTGELAWLRLLPLAWSLLAVAAAWRLGARRGPALGAWWAALLAVSMPLASFSVTLRPYSLAVLTGLLAWLALDELLERGRSRPYAAAQALFQLAYPHAWLAGLAQLAFVSLRRRDAFRPLLLALIPSWLALGAWLAAWHLAVPTAGGFHYEVAWSALGLIARSFSQAQGAGLLLYPALCAAAAAAAMRAGPLKDFVLLAALSSALPLLAIFAVHRAESVLLLPRHALPLLPAYLGVVAAGCAAAQGWAAARSRTAGFAAAGALAAAVGWGALGPLAALAGRERALSDYLAGFARELRQRARASDILIFADPNSGATVLHALDRRAFDALSGIRMREGFALFQLPPRLEAAAGDAALEAYALCPLDPALATVDAGRLRALRAGRPGRRFWLVTLEGLNAAPNADPFAALGLSPADLVPAGPGLARLR